jgi:hypothetical protein
MEDGKPIEHCAFDAPSYRNQNPTGQEFGRWNLRASGAVMIIPRSPLRPGSRYSVSITANDNTYAWSFTVAETATTFTAIARFPTSAAPVPTAPPVTEPTKAHRRGRRRRVHAEARDRRGARPRRQRRPRSRRRDPRS